jgi:putative toxin-antitoxin system antitoxin component (TIGR02293 family)
MSEGSLKYGNSDYPHLGGSEIVNEPQASYGSQSRIKLIRRGLPLKALSYFLKDSKLNQQELSTILQISPRTMQRYSADQMLPPTVSEKLLMLNDLYEKGDFILGAGTQNVTNWLRSPVAALGNQRPLDYLDTYEGFNEVMKVLGRLEWGVAS